MKLENCYDICKKVIETHLRHILFLIRIAKKVYKMARKIFRHQVMSTETHKLIMAYCGP